MQVLLLDEAIMHVDDDSCIIRTMEKTPKLNAIVCIT